MSDYDILEQYEHNLMIIEDKTSGDRGTTNIELNKLGKQVLKSKFLGVFSSNTIPKNSKNNTYFIVNNKKTTERGEHWLACVIYNDKKYMFDTFARRINKLSPLFKGWIEANKKRDQSYNEVNCGPRCLSWLISFYNYGPRIINII